MAFGNAGRSLKLYLQGDTSDLEKALSRAEYKLKRFDRGAGGSAARGLGGAGALSLARGGLFAAAGAGAALGLKSSVEASKNAEVILGQTQVALRDAGLSWQVYGSQVERESQRISKSSAFDDEAVMQSFSVFVRGQKDVGKSLQLAALAADVARGRYVDLDSATQLVNKAAMGQIGALRRAGIQIDKNATSTQALEALQRAYGGSAKKYADTSAGAADNARVAWENFREELGSNVTPALGRVAKGLEWVGERMQTTQASVEEFQSADFQKRFQDAFGIDALQSALKDLAPQINQARQDFLNAINPTNLNPAGNPTIGNPGLGRRTDAAKLRDPIRVGAASPVITRMSARLEERLAVAQRTQTSSDDLQVLGKMKKFLEGALTDLRLNPSERASLQQSLTGVVNEIQGIYDDQAAAAKDARDEARRNAADAKRRQQEALRKAAEAATSFASGLKDSALAILDNRQNKISWQRDLTDAKEQLRFAKLVGDPYGIRDANRAVQDAQLQRQRWQIENANVKPMSASSAQIVMNGVTVVANNPQQLIDAIAKAAKRNTGQVRGRLAPTTLIH